MGKAVMFFGFVWAITCIAGGVLMGHVAFATTTLTADITADATTITVASTQGFPEPGIIVIEAERIAYSATTNTTFYGTAGRPLIRGNGDTDAVAHVTGRSVRQVETSLINSSIDYDVAIMADASGALAFVEMGLAVFDILLSFGKAPFSFLGTDLQILTIIWGIMFLGLIVSFVIAMIGGRRV